MTTKVKYNVVPQDGDLDTANKIIDKIIERAPKNIDELSIEVADLFSVKARKFNVMNESFKDIHHSNIQVQ